MLTDIEAIVSDIQDGKKPELRLWLRLLSTTKLMSQEIRRRLRLEFDATLPQFDIMSQLFREGDGLRLGELSRRTMVTNGNITGLIERLEADDLVIREKLEEDKRVTFAKLTEKGRRTFEDMAKAHERWLREMMADVDPIILAGLLVHVGQVKRSVLNHIAEEIPERKQDG